MLIKYSQYWKNGILFIKINLIESKYMLKTNDIW